MDTSIDLVNFKQINYPRSPPLSFHFTLFIYFYTFFLSRPAAVLEGPAPLDVSHCVALVPFLVRTSRLNERERCKDPVDGLGRDSG